MGGMGKSPAVGSTEGVATLGTEESLGQDPGAALLANNLPSGGQRMLLVMQ